MTKPTYDEKLPRVAAWERVTDVPLTAIAVVFLVAYAYPILDPGLPDWAKSAMTMVDIAIWGIFAVDYFGRLLIAEDRWWFVRKNLVDLLLVVVPPARPLRLLRLTALLIEAMWRHMKHRARARMAIFVGGTTSLLIFLASLAMLDAERGHPDSQIENFADALWWAVVSVTTVGYGDLTPVTSEGRLVALFLMAVGIGLIGFITGSVTSWVIDKINELSKAEAETQADVGAVLTSVHTLQHELTAIRRELAELRAETQATRSDDLVKQPAAPE